MSSHNLEHFSKIMTIEEFGKYIELKNHDLVEEKKRKYSYVDDSGKEFKPLTPSRLANVEIESCHLSLKEESSTIITSSTSSSKELRLNLLKSKLQQLSKGKPLKLENPFRSMNCQISSKQESSGEKSLKFCQKKSFHDDTTSS